MSSKKRSRQSTKSVSRRSRSMRRKLKQSRKSNTNRSNGGSRDSAVMQRSLTRLRNLYNQDGSGKTQYGGADINDLVSKIVSNRVLDVYLKYLGLTMLNSATLVPFALIMGKEYFEKYLGPRLEKEERSQKGGQFGGGEPLPRVVPLFDHPYIGTFLKLAGIPLVGLTTNTLVPLGILMIVYEMINQLSSGEKRASSKKGGRRSQQRGGYGSQYAAGPLYSALGNAPVENTYNSCLNFAPQAECCNTALEVQKIQHAIVPPHTNYPEFQKTFSCSTGASATASTPKQ